MEILQNRPPAAGASLEDQVWESQWLPVQLGTACEGNRKSEAFLQRTWPGVREWRAMLICYRHTLPELTLLPSFTLMLSETPV